MRAVKVAALQFKINPDYDTNLKQSLEMIREAAKNGAKVILLPELFETVYFCQERRYEYYDLATSVNDNQAIKVISELCKELDVVIPVPFFERDGNNLYNSVAVIDADGTNLGVYRKSHIPDDHYYQEKFYFTPGNTGYKVFDTKYLKLGVGICWDQWFPEVARCLCLNGAELLYYPTCIGSELILECDSAKMWRRVMQGHAIANLTPVVAPNRIGIEKVEPHMSNNFQSTALEFYGSSFMTDGIGEIVESASRDQNEILYHEYDLDALDHDRMAWGLFRDRRPLMYKDIIK